MNIQNFLDSTFLPNLQSNLLTAAQLQLQVEQIVQEAIHEQFKAVIVYPEWLTTAKQLLASQNAKVLLGTVIDFPEGKAPLELKLDMALQAMENGADELDFVIDYNAFKNGQIDWVKTQVLHCTLLALAHQKTIKWIIETAALTPSQIVQLCALIKNVVLAHCNENQYERVFVKSSTGYFAAPVGISNGATPQAIQLMIENAFPLPVKASGGIRTLQQAQTLLALGVKRIGTSSAKAIITNAQSNSATTY